MESLQKSKQSPRFEFDLWRNYPVIAGLDEAGRGAIAGPLVVSGVIMPPNFQHPLINDSKKLSPSQRRRAFLIIKESALEIKTVFKSVQEVEVKNPLASTKEAMVEIIKSFTKKPDLCLIDGKEEIKIDGFTTISIIAGDSKSINIAAASIVSKVIRDDLMIELSNSYPSYSWERNKGYPNKEHITALLMFGVCELHRKTYEPIKSIIQDGFDSQLIYKKYNLLS